MARKKRSIAPLSITAADRANSLDAAADLERHSETSYASVRIDCERAVKSFRHGNHPKALKQMEELCSKYTNPSHLAFISQVRAILFTDLASLVSEPKAKRRYFLNAVEAAMRAVSLSPRSIAFAHFYALLLFQLANRGRVEQYDQVVQVCEKALAVENPVDPLNVSLDQDQWKNQKFTTAESRVVHIQTELRSLIQMSNISSILTWMNNLGNAEQKFELMPLSRIVGDKTVQDSADMRLFGESKTAEYGRKETEAKMVSDWLEQQMSKSSSSGNKVNNHNDNNKEFDSSLLSKQRGGDSMKRDKERKTTHFNEIERVRPYWNSMSSDRKKDLLKVSIADLQEHLGHAVKDGSANAVLNEAISFGKENKVWAFFMCYHCYCKFSDNVSFRQHVANACLPDLPSELKSLFPESVKREWAKKNLYCSWKPLDLNALVRILEKQSEPKVPEIHEPEHNTDVSKDCWTGTYSNDYESNSSPGKHKSDENELMDFDGDRGSRDSLLSDDSERTMLLEKTLVFLKGLFKHKCLAISHVKWIENAAVWSLQGLACGSQLDCSSISDQTSLFIRALGAPELKQMLTFLQDIFLNAGILGQYSDPKSDVWDAYTTTEKTVLSEDASYLVLAEHFVPFSNPFYSCDEGGLNASTSPSPGYEDGATLDSDALLSWIFTASSSAKELAAWKHVRDDRTKRGLESLKLLQEVFYQFRDPCKRKDEHMKYHKALMEMERLCLQEATKGKQAMDSVPRTQSYKSVLMTRQEELIKISKGATVYSELNAITDVLKDAMSLSDQKDYFDETYSVVSEDHNWRTKASFKGDFCIELSLRRKILEVGTELNRMDARIMRIIAESDKVSNKNDVASFHDCRSILIPLVKSFLRARLEDLAEKEAKKESDASKETLLTEFSLDSKKDKKKKKKGNGKKKYPEVINSAIPHDQTAEEILLLISDEIASPYSGDDADPVTNGDGRLQEENSHIMGLETEAKASDVQVTLANHGQIEDEAKQDHLSEQHNATKQNAEIIDNSKNDGFDNILEGSTTANASMLSSGSSSEQHTDPNKLSDGINQTMTSEKKDNDADSLVFGSITYEHLVLANFNSCKRSNDL